MVERGGCDALTQRTVDPRFLVALQHSGVPSFVRAAFSRAVDVGSARDCTSRLSMAESLQAARGRNGLAKPGHSQQGLDLHLHVQKCRQSGKGDAEGFSQTST